MLAEPEGPCIRVMIQGGVPKREVARPQRVQTIRTHAAEDFLVEAVPKAKVTWGRSRRRGWLSAGRRR